MKLLKIARTGLLLAAVAVLTTGSIGSLASTTDFAIAQSPLFLGGNTPPLMMMVMSRDEQLFNKAYSDYTNLQEGDANDTGSIDTTYDNTFDYAGYFDPLLCYGYSNGLFKASGKATNHQCSSAWSGNFLNWVTMSRLDIVRHVLYGGKRSTDTPGQTILERAPIPNDLHAWVKVYSGSDIGSYVPGGSGTMSFCNATITSGGVPLMRQANGAWPEWAATSLYQCGRNRSDDGKLATPPSTADYTVRVDVCSNSSARESFCRSYSDGANTRYKPAGLLQEYGESGKLRFGLISGSYSQPRKGGVLRRNIGLFAGNDSSSTCASNNKTGGVDEVKTTTGQFCKNIVGSSSDEGIIRTLDNFELTKWNGSTWVDCDGPGILNQDMRDQTTGAKSCIGWGNPLAEMYAEALRYVSGESSATSSFINSATNDLSGLPINVAWKDPYRSEDKGGNSYCASCSILVLSSGAPSFDSDNLPNFGAASASTTTVGSAEGLRGNYFVGRASGAGAPDDTNYKDYCTSKTLSGLGGVLGICPDAPATEGSYLIAGLAYQSHINDVRASKVPAGRPAGVENTVTTYVVQMAESLPSFKIPVGDGAITLSPLCQANTNAKATSASDGWRTCFLGSVSVGTTQASVDPNYIYGRNLQYSGGKLVAGSYMLVWEDSMWGNDHDNDVVTMLSFCVGSFCKVGDSSKSQIGSVQNICWRSSSSFCSRGAMDNEVMIRLETLSEYAGHSLLNGFTVTGSDADGTKRELLAPGGWFTSILTAQKDPPKDGDVGGRNGWDPPVVYRFKAGSGSTGVLENPLWYAAKYGSFTREADGNDLPDQVADWDANGDGSPDGYFLARDPSKLKQRLDEILQKAAGGTGATGGAASGARLTSSSYTIETGFNVPEESNDWTGSVIAYNVASDGSKTTVRWSAIDKLPASGSRNIRTVLAPTVIKGSNGTVQTTVNAKQFNYANLGGCANVLPKLGLSANPSWLGSLIDCLLGDAGVKSLVNYLRGDQTQEQKVGGKFRNRTSVIGDIVNSTVETTSPKDDYGYGGWAGSTDTTLKALGTSYQTFLQANLDSTTPKPTLYVNANDGMLHAFDAAENGGRERFAFIPSVSRERMGELANPDYSHWYTMDGAITLSHVPSTTTGGWRTLLVTSVGEAGRSVSALDVSNPDAFDDNSVLWELRGTDGTNAYLDDLGYVMGKPMIVPVAGPAATGPRWVALFGNGVDSSTGDPALFVVDVNTGRVLKVLKPTSGSYGKNGLMSIAPVSLFNSKGLVDIVYGADVRGNVWRFDLSSANIANWNISFASGNKPLFSAEDGDGKEQPITGGLEVARAPGGGVSIFFGTGRYFAVGDNAPNGQVQSLYGIIDTCAAADCNASEVIKGDREDALVEQTIASGGSGGGYQIRTVSQNAAGKRGWFIDLAVNGVSNGERFIGTPRLQNGKVFFTTYQPTGNDCDPGGISWLYGLSVASGGGAMSGVSVAPGGASVCTGDCGALSLGKGAPVKETNILLPQPPPAELTCPASDPTCSKLPSLTAGLELRQCTLVLRAAGASPLYLARPCGRQSWRQIR